MTRTPRAATAADDRFATGAALADALCDAFAGTLDPTLRRRADALVRALPWAAPNVLQ